MVGKGDQIVFKARLTAKGDVPPNPVTVFLQERLSNGKLEDRGRVTVTPDPNGNPVPVTVTHIPMEVGEKFFLVPEWRDDAPPPGRFRITVNPRMAFGTGVHESTRLCLEAMEEFVRPGSDVLDVGTGSGILAKAADLLGARRVIAGASES